MNPPTDDPRRDRFESRTDHVLRDVFDAARGATPASSSESTGRRSCSCSQARRSRPGIWAASFCSHTARCRSAAWCSRSRRCRVLRLRRAVPAFARLACAPCIDRAGAPRLRTRVRCGAAGAERAAARRSGRSLQPARAARAPLDPCGRRARRPPIRSRGPAASSSATSGSSWPWRRQGHLSSRRHEGHPRVLAERGAVDRVVSIASSSIGSWNALFWLAA